MAQNPEPVNLSRAALEALAAASVSALPMEAGGLLAGPSGSADVTVVRALSNERRSGSRFVASARALNAAHAELLAAGLELRGFFHSHVNEPPVPSSHDTAHAREGDLHVIVGLRDGEVAEVRAWLAQAPSHPMVEVEVDSLSRLPGVAEASAGGGVDRREALARAAGVRRHGAKARDDVGPGLQVPVVVDVEREAQVQLALGRRRRAIG